MIKAEFGIIDEIDPKKDDSAYEPQNYHCIAIDDDLYLNDWWPELLLMQTYFHSPFPGFSPARRHTDPTAVASCIPRNRAQRPADKSTD